MRIYQKILVAALSCLFILGVITVSASIRALQQRGEDEIAAQRDLMLAEKTLRLKNIVEVAISNLEAVNGRSDLSLEARQDLAKGLISSIRYNTSDYIWINDMRAVIVMHPIKPQLDGKDLSDFKDPNGKKLFSAFVEVCARQGEGTVDYLWPKPGHEEPVPKLSYVKRYESWDWVVGTGIYLDDIDAVVAVKKAELAGVIKRQCYTLIGTSLTIFVLAGLVLTWVTGRIVTPIKRTNAMLKDIAEGQGDLTQRLTVTSKDEVGELAQWFNAFMAKLQEVIAKVTENATALTASASALSEVSTKMDEEAHTSSERTNAAATASAEMDAHMQTMTTAMQEVNSNIQEVETQSQMTSDIAASVERATRTVAEVSDQTEQTSEVAAGIARDVAAVDQASAKLQQNSAHVNASAGDMAGLAQTLAELVGRFSV